MAATAATSADVCTAVAAEAPKATPTFDQLPLASSSLSPQEAGRWLSVIIPLLKYAGSPGDWGRESKLGVLTMRLMQVRAEILAMNPEDVQVMARPPFVHVPRAAMVSTDYPTLRRFAAETETSHGMPASAAEDCTIHVLRHAKDKKAILGISIGTWCKASTDAYMQPDQLRELAHRLLDAAHDIETNPSEVLMVEIEAARGAA